MVINYQETTKDLLSRINIHNKFGSKDIDKWTLDLLRLSKGMNILDIGCGTGKQCFSYYRYLNGAADIIGGDVSERLLEHARQENINIENRIFFANLDFNKQFPFEDNRFNMVSCCFAIYYAEDIPFTLEEIHRVMIPGAKLFVSGPAPKNKRLFYDIIYEATGIKLPPMPGNKRYHLEVLSHLKSKFSKSKVHIFENPITFKTAEPFMEYTYASLSRDRKLWNDFFQSDSEFKDAMQQICEVVACRLQQENELVMTKVVYGFLATK